MKKNILFSIGMFFSLFATGQSSLLDYDGGEIAYAKLMTRKLQPPDEIYKKDTSSVFNIIMIIDTNGLINRIVITSFGDSIGTGMILGVIKLTQSKWINHSGKDQVVTFQIYFIPGEEPRQDISSVNTRNYWNWSNESVTNFHYILVSYYKPVT